MTQRKSIAGAIKHAALGMPAPATVLEKPTAPAALRPFKAGTREGKKMIAAPIDPAAHRQLKMLAAETGQKAEELIREGLRDLFTKYGKPPIS